MKRVSHIILCLVLALASASAPARNVKVSFAPDSVRVLRNPLSGWVMYLGRTWDDDFWDVQGYDHMKTNTGETVRVSDYAGTAYIRTSWSSLEPQKGVYAWRDSTSRVYRLFKSVQDRGMRLAFRIVVDGRDQGQNTPMFVIEDGAAYYTSGNGRHKSPYPDDPVFQKHYENFVRALAEDFNDPDKVDFIDAYGLGKWGESHGMIYSDPADKHAVFDWITTLYTSTFTKVPLLIHYHRVIGVGDGESYGDVAPDTDSLLVSAIDKGYSLRHDAFGMTDYYQKWEKDFAARWNFRRPIIFEGGWITAAHHRYWMDPCGKYREGHSEDVRRGEFEAAREAHANTMDYRVNDETRSWFTQTFDLVKSFVAEGGYRLYPSSVTVPAKARRGRTIHVSHTWDNLGWGYCPNNIPQWNYRYKPALALLDSDGKPVRVYVDDAAEPSEWIMGSRTSYDFEFKVDDIPQGTYTWGVAIIDRTEDCRPGLEIAVSADRVNAYGWTPLSRVKIR